MAHSWHTQSEFDTFPGLAPAHFGMGLEVAGLVVPRLVQQLSTLRTQREEL
jgi:hypothetical protein